MANEAYKKVDQKLKKFIKSCIPPVLLPLYRRFFARPLGHAHLTGFYESWEEALSASSGYNDPLIFEKVCQAALKVQRGEALYERDSVCFYSEEYRWPTLAAFLWLGAQISGEIRVVDFGGSMASFYFQHKRFLERFQWAVIEQEHFVEFAQEHFQNEMLTFHKNVEELAASGSIDVVFLSSVLQYLEEPFEVLENLLRHKPRFLLVDRTSFVKKKYDILRVQHVPESIYKASYPIWFFSEDKFQKTLDRKGYKIQFMIPDATDWGFGYHGGFLAKLTYEEP